MADADPAAIVADAIDARSLVDLVVAAVRASVTPHEEQFAHWVRESLRAAAGTRSRLRDAEPGRPNVYAASGAGDGRSLVLARPSRHRARRRLGVRTGRAPTAPTRSPASSSTGKSGAAEPRT